MEQTVVLKPTLAARYAEAMSRGRVVLFSAPCGFGKTTAAHALAAGRVWARSADQPDFSLPTQEELWDTLLIDDLQYLTEKADQDALCELIRTCPQRRFLLLTRGVTPSWLLPFQIAGMMAVLGPWDLALDRESAGLLLQRMGAQVTSRELTAIHEETKGCALPISLLARRLALGEGYSPSTADQVRLELFLYFETAVFHRLELPLQRLLLELAPFEQFGPELARMVSGNSRSGELLGRLQRETSALVQDRLDQYHFWPVFRRFLLWELEQSYDQEQQKALYNRGGLYYELAEDYSRALECYSRSGDFAKVSELLSRNAQLHPGMGHYDEMEPYYRALPEREILASPALMQAMSMLEAMCMDFPRSERWYQALQEFIRCRRRTDAAGREARGRLTWLDLALPQRKVEGMLELFPKAFQLLTSREISLPPFSVTSTLPSLMNGGKDFSPWSRRDDLLYATLRVPVEAVLGRDGVCLADCAITESKFEKGENVKDRVLSLMSHLERIRRDGTPDMEFAVVGLLARTQVDAGRAADARHTLTTLRERFSAAGETRFLPNLDAMLCRVDLRLGDDDAVDRWYREKAPRDPQRLRSLKRYQYLTQAMTELALGDPEGALLTLAPLGPYCTACARYIDGIHLRILSAIARFRLGEETWKAELHAALDTAARFRFLRPVSQYGAALLPLAEDCGWPGDPAFLRQVLTLLRRQRTCYPDFLQPRREMTAPLSAAELQVLRLICADKSNGEIGEILGIKVATVKVHVSHILQKLGVRRRSEAKSAALRLRLV